LTRFIKRFEKIAERVEVRPYMQNRKVYHLSDVRVEVVPPIENSEFCLHCTRIRLTSDGKLKPCLMRNDNVVDVLTPLRSGADDEFLTKLFLEAVDRREPYWKPGREA
jgi:cyclic pyranopterin phosphate synthase